MRRIWGGRQRNNEGRAPPPPFPSKPQGPSDSLRSQFCLQTPVQPPVPRRARAEHPWVHPMPELPLAPPSPSGIHQAPPIGTSQVRLGSSSHLPAGCPRSGSGQHTHRAGVGVREAPGAPARSGSGVGFGMRRHSLTHPTGPGSFGDAARQEPRQDRTEHPGLASPPAPPDPASCSPPARCHQCSHIWACWVCWGSLPLATFWLPLGTGNQPSGSARPDRQELSGSAGHS